MTVDVQRIPAVAGNEGRPLVANNGGTRITFGDPGWVNVKLRGVAGDGTDEAAAINAVLDESLFVLFPETATSYVVGSPLAIRSNHHLSGIGPTAPYGSKPQIKAAGGFNSPIIDCTTTTNYVTIRNLAFQGRTASGSKGIYVADGSRWHIADCIFDSFGDQAIHMVIGVAPTIDHIFVDNALLVTTGRTDYVGTVDIGCEDARLYNIEAGAPSTGIGDGFRAAIVARGSVFEMRGCRGQLSEVGIVLIGGLGRVTGNLADINYGHGWVIKSSANVLNGNLSYRNSQDTDNAYDGFRVTSGSAIANVFTGNIVSCLAADAKKMRYGFNDDATGSAGPDSGNKYSDNAKSNINGALYNITGLSEHGIAGLVGRDFQIGYGGGHNTGHQMLGSAHIWVDSTGDLRIKSSAPTSDTDGTVVGTQS